MPAYEYKCKKCEYQFEAFQGIRDEPLKICPECGGEIRRLISGGAGVIFKGPGFYVTDKAAQPKNAAKTAKTAENGAAKEGGKPEAASAKPGAGDGKQKDGVSPAKPPPAQSASGAGKTAE